MQILPRITLQRQMSPLLTDMEGNTTQVAVLQASSLLPTCTRHGPSQIQAAEPPLTPKKAELGRRWGAAGWLSHSTTGTSFRSTCLLKRSQEGLAGQWCSVHSTHAYVMQDGWKPSGYTSTTHVPLLIP